MANDSKTLYQSFTKKGMTKEDAFFAVMDHHNALHFHDRDLLTEENKKLKERIKQLEGDAE